MKIIEKGKTPKEPRYRNTCCYCGTIFEFNHSELYSVITEDVRDVGTVRCPQCNGIIPVFQGSKI